MKCIEPLGQTGWKKLYYQYTAIDDCTDCESSGPTPQRPENCDRNSSIILSKLPFQVEKVQTDNCQEFGSAFHWHLLDKASGTSRSDPEPHA